MEGISTLTYTENLRSVLKTRVTLERLLSIEFQPFELHSSRHSRTEPNVSLFVSIDMYQKRDSEINYIYYIRIDVL